MSVDSIKRKYIGHTLKAFCILSVFVLTGCPDMPAPMEGPASNEARFASIDKIHELIEPFELNGDPAVSQEIAGLLNGLPEIAEATVFAGSVIARFTDGEVLIVINTRAPAERDASDNRRIIGSARPGVKAKERTGDAAAIVRVSPDETATVLPSSKKALLINAMGNYYTDDTPTLNTWFETSGYAPSIGDGSIEGFRKDVKDIGVLYVSSHGALMPWSYIAEVDRQVLEAVAETPPPDHLFAQEVKERTHFIIWTRTVITNDTVEAYRDEVKRGRLVYLIAPNDKGPDGEATNGRHFGITELFIHDNWRCKPGALMYMDCCWAAMGAIRDVCIDAKVNAATYIGWDSTSFDNATSSTVLYFFDRALGMNAYLPPAKPQRPFSVREIESSMRSLTRRELGVTDLKPRINPDLPLIKTGKGGHVSELTVYFQPPVFDEVLRPGIRSLKASDEVLTLNGTFGDEAGKVSIAGSPLSVRSWTTNRIECDLPASGTGSHGHVTVEAAERISNARALTQWNVTFKRLFMDYPTQGGIDCPACFYEATMDYTFRADIAEIRLVPDGAVTATNYTGAADEGGINVTNAGGSYSIGQGSTITLAPNSDDGAAFIGTCVGFLPPADNNFLGACFFLNGDEHSIAFSPTLFAEGLLRNYTGGAFDGIVDPYQVTYSGNLIGNELILSFSPNYTIEAGNQSTGANSYFEWSSADAHSPPAPADPL